MDGARVSCEVRIRQCLGSGHSRIDSHLRPFYIAVCHSHYCKGFMAITVLSSGRMRIWLGRHWSIPLGHSHPSSSFFACKSSLGLSVAIIYHFVVPFFLELRYGIAIPSYRWLRLVYGWAASHWISGVRSYRQLFEPSSDALWCAYYKRIDNGEKITKVLNFDSTNWCPRKLHKITVPYDPIVDACVFLHTNNALANAIGVLVVDVVLLLIMLIGLLRLANRNSTGLWNLLYQQVTIRPFSLSCARCEFRSSA